MSTEPIKEVFLFDPLSIPGCCLWLDAADRTVLFSDFAGTLPVSTGSQRLSYWKDKSTSNNHATNNTSTPTVTYQSLNSYPTVSFAGSNFLNLTSTSLPNGGTNASYFFVCRTTNTGVYVFFSHGPTPAQQGQTPQFYFNSGQIYADTYGSNAIYDNSTQTNNYLTLSFIRNGNMDGWLHGSSFIGSNNTVIATNTGTGFATLGVGRVLANLNYYFQGNMAEMIIYNTDLTETNRQLIEGYLANKWGINPRLPSNHPYLEYRPLLSNLPLPLIPRNPLRAINIGSPPYSGFPTVITQSYFTPKSIGALSFWLDAADASSVIRTGNAVTQWSDKSGNGKDASAFNSPIYTGNSIVLNGSSQYLTSALTIDSATHTFIAIHKPSSSGANTSLFRFQTSGTPYIVFPYSGRGYITSYDGTPINFQNSTLVDNSVTTAFNLIIATIQSGTQVVYLNGTQTATTAQSLTSSTSPTMYIGAYFSGPSEFYGGSICEMIIYNSFLTRTDREKIEGYLAWKWGIANLLPSSHPFKNIPPTP